VSKPPARPGFDRLNRQLLRLLLLVEQHDRAPARPRGSKPIPSGFRQAQPTTGAPRARASRAAPRQLLLVEQHDRACEAARVETPSRPGFDRLNRQQGAALVVVGRAARPSSRGRACRNPIPSGFRQAQPTTVMSAGRPANWGAAKGLRAWRGCPCRCADRGRPGRDRSDREPAAASTRTRARRRLDDSAPS